MPRWEGGSQERLQSAALELFMENGYAATTTAAIAERAGVTERTLHRLFGDKREILFTDGRRIESLLLNALSRDTPPAEALATAFHALAHDMQPRHKQLARRAAVIAATPELVERELLKVRSWSVALSRELTERGVDSFAATAHAEVAVAIFRVAYVTWVDSDEGTQLTSLIAEAVEALRAT
jgi:AcrR family transcriptional regulator